VHDHDGLIGVVDILFPEAAVVIEIDGRQAHDNPDRFETDRFRQNRLTVAGYLVLRYTWRQILTGPDRIVAEVRHAVQDHRPTRGKRPERYAFPG
jgi:very-short-patch-repair endonuclease